MAASAASIEFPRLIIKLADYFAGEPAAVSVNTEHYGTITREDVTRLLPVCERMVDAALSGC